jgi:hypothetical protein
MTPRVTGAPTPELQADVEALLSRMAIPDAAYREREYLVVTAGYGRLVAGTTYRVSPSGHLRVRGDDGTVALFRRWRCLCALGPGVLRGVDFAPEARCVAVRPAPARPRRRSYRPEVPIGPSGNRLLREQLAELKRRPEAERA